jgi:putative nucleotidyltransferase with HDIG domain
LLRPLIYQNTKHLLFVVMMVLFFVGTASVLMNLHSSSFIVYLIPFAILPIIIRTFFDSRTAFTVHLVTVLLVGLEVPNAFEFTLLQLTAGLTTIYSLKDLTQRSQLIKTAALIFVNYTVIYFGYSLLVKGTLTELDKMHFLYFGINSLLVLFAYVLIYIFERIFGFLSSVTLVELSNVNSPLLQQYSERAPGSFQHSLQVANLASEAAKKINGNALLVRIGAIYHDIGKMSNPLYFIENQISGVNPLKDMDLEQAAQCIISHVSEGVKIAQKHNIPESIVNFIRTHHGNSKAWFFYNSFRNRFPDQPVNEDAFSYNCPPPATKEQAILMMADAVEASSRSLNEYSDESINTLVDSIIDKQIVDGLLKCAKITFVDVEKVKSLFKEKLKTIYHTRVSYPEISA